MQKNKNKMMSTDFQCFINKYINHLKQYNKREKNNNLGISGFDAENANFNATINKKYYNINMDIKFILLIIGLFIFTSVM